MPRVIENGEETIQLTAKGIEGINDASKLREDTIEVVAGIFVHKICRRDYCNKYLIDRDVKIKQHHEGPSSTRVLRSSEPAFNFREHCLFCGNSAESRGRKRVSQVTSDGFQTTIKRLCKERGEDSWAVKVLSIIEFAPDLRAFSASYYQACCSNFKIGRASPPISPQPHMMTNRYIRVDHWMTDENRLSLK